MLAFNESEPKYLLYEGPFNIEVISSLAKFLRENIDAPEFVRRKLYRVFIELVQNVSLYSLERATLKNNKTNGKGQVFIIEREKQFQCTTKNKIQKEHAPILVKNCTDINSSSLEELRIRKKKLRELIKVQDTGAHIGLIMIKTYSGNPLKFEVTDDQENGDTYFSITTTISKEIIS